MGRLNLDRAHRLVVDTYRLFEKERPDIQTGIMTPPRWTKCLDVRSSRAMLSRMFNIAVKLCKGFDKRGYRIVLGDDRNCKSSVVVGGENVGFRVMEKKAQVLWRDSWYVKHGGYSQLRPPRYGWAPSGIASVMLSEVPIRSYETGKVFSDGPRVGRVEDRIDSILDAVEAYAAKLAREREKRTVAHEEWKRAYELRVAEERRQQEEQQRMDRRIEHLVSSAKSWSDAKLMREYVDAIVARTDFNDDSELGKWVAWAREYIESVDPLNDLMSHRLE